MFVVSPFSINLYFCIIGPNAIIKNFLRNIPSEECCKYVSVCPCGGRQKVYECMT